MLYGRDTERELIAGLLENARRGHGGALVLHGDAGVGKTALLDAVVAEADEWQVLRTRGVEAESPLPFAALHRLMQPLVPSVPKLPAPQARAVGQVLGLEEEAETGNERFLVFLGLLTLLSDAAESKPVLCSIDDAHWLDDASAAALLFVARRIEVAPVAMLFGTREGGPRRFDWDDLPNLALPGLDRAAATALLAATRQIESRVREELISRTAGNPLALREIPAALTAEQLSGGAPLPSHLPLTDGLERVFLDRHSRLPGEAQQFALLVAADDTGDASTIRHAAAVVGVSAGEAEAIRSGLVIDDGGHMRMQHPLVRSAVYTSAATVDRRRMHAALASALATANDTDRSVWHQAAALDRPDDAVAAALHRAAVRSQQQGAHEAASAAFARAAELSTGHEVPARLAAAATSAWLAGKPDRTRALAQSAKSRTDDPVITASMDRLRAFVEMNFGSPELAHGILARASNAAAVRGDIPLARQLAMIATALGAFGHSSGAALDVQPLLENAAEAPAEVTFSALLAGLDHLVHDRVEHAAVELRRAFTAAEGQVHPDLLTNIGLAATHIGDDSAALRFHAIELEAARSSSSPLHTLHALTRGGIVHAVTSRWAALAADTSEALDLARVTGHRNQRSLPLAQRLLLSAYRGSDRFDEAAAEAEQASAEHPAGVLDQLIADTIAWAKAASAGRADPLAVLHQLRRIRSPILRRASFLDLAEAADANSDIAALTIAAGDMRRYANATGARWAAAAAEHGQALLAGDDFAGHFDNALLHHDRSVRVFDRARTHLAYGERLRRARRRVDARNQFRAALAIFDDLGAAPWSARAAEELRASGETTRRRTPEPSEAVLTAQELHVARLVQQGLSNRDVAARLFISPRTVDFHLRNVFAKLGVSSRGGLVNVPLD